MSSSYNPLDQWTGSETTTYKCPVMASMERNMASFNTETERIVAAGRALDAYDEKRKMWDHERDQSIHRMYDTVIGQATEFNEVLKKTHPVHTADQVHTLHKYQHLECLKI